MPIDQPSREEVKQAIESSQSIQNNADSLEMDKKYHDLDWAKTEAFLISAERKELIAMRSRWSNWILAVIVTISIFDMCLIGLIGGKIWVFENNFAIPLFVGESLIKLLGLAFLIVHFLFDHKSLAEKHTVGNSK